MNKFNDYLEEIGEIGYVSGINNFIIFVSGLPGLMLSETVVTESGKTGVVYSINDEKSEILMFDSERIKVGERVVRTGKQFQFPVSDGLLGRVIDSLGHPIDGLGPVEGKKEYLDIKRRSPGIVKRAKIREPLDTGVAIVDLMVPIGYGQRELVIGDAKTGKTNFILQTIVSQARKGTICIYVGIGKRDTAIKLVEEYLKRQKVFDNVVIMNTTPDDSPVMIHLSPYCGMTIAEYFRDKGKRVLIVLDDLTTHARNYREMSLLSGRAPGRDSYPGEIFYIQSSLLERAGNIKTKNGNVSITAIPIAETLENDLSGYIQTNLMAMTDGHIFFDSNEFKKGRRPAVNIFLSVSRVGNQTRTGVEKELSGLIRRILNDYQRILAITQFGSELPPETKKTLDTGEKIGILFNQKSGVIIPRQLQLILVGLLLFGFWESKSIKEMEIGMTKIVDNYEYKILPIIRESKEKMDSIASLKTLVDRIVPKLSELN